jgi:hypothetical protein
LRIFSQLFRRKSTAEEDPSLLQRIAALETRWRDIETEWNDWYEKFRILHLRLARRQKALEASEQTETPLNGVSNGADPATAAPPLNSSPGMSDEQKAWQQKILRQRGRM